MPSSVTVQVSPDDGGVRSLAAKLATALDQLAIGGWVRFRAELVAEEIVTNLVKYGGAPVWSEPIELVMQRTQTGLLLSFLDRGEPFDPRLASERPGPPSIDEETTGGFGLRLVRKAASRLAYGRQPDGRNRLDVWISPTDGTKPDPV